MRRKAANSPIAGRFFAMAPRAKAIKSFGPRVSNPVNYRRIYGRASLLASLNLLGRFLLVTHQLNTETLGDMHRSSLRVIGAPKVASLLCRRRASNPIAKAFPSRVDRQLPVSAFIGVEKWAVGAQQARNRQQPCLLIPKEGWGLA